MRIHRFSADAQAGHRMNSVNQSEQLNLTAAQAQFSRTVGAAMVARWQQTLERADEHDVNATSLSESHRETTKLQPGASKSPSRRARHTDADSG
jgi:L-arabinose isomerase